MNKILSLQFLRAFACLSVLFTHILQNLKLQPFGDYYISGGYGVDIFFMLSGFLIYITTKDNDNWKVFAVKRFFRIFPLYWFSFFLFLSWAIINPGKSYSLIFFLQNLLMMPWSGPLTSKSLLVGVAWSTVYEVYFYFIFTLLLFLKLKKKYIALLLISLLCLMKISYSINLFQLKETALYPFMYSLVGSSHIIPFIGGTAIGIFSKNELLLRTFNNNLKLLRILFLASHLLYFFILITQYNQIKSFAISSVIFLFWVFIDKIWTINYDFILSKILIKIGDISYSVYLLHILVIRVLIIKFKIDELLFLTVTSYLFTIIISLFTYKFIEEPFMNLGKKAILKYYPVRIKV